MARMDTTTSRYTLKAYFIKDSFRIGERIRYSVTARYPKSEVAIFPDSSFNYAPFEFIEKIYYPTRSNSEYAVDSVVYIVSSFEIFNRQYLSMGIRFVNKTDTVVIHTERDSIHLIHLVKSSLVSDLTDQAKLTDTPADTNYPYILITIVACLLFLYLLYTIFGKIIVRRYRLFIVQRSHNRFIKEFDKLTNDFLDHTELRVIEQTLSLWKNYLTRLESKPINTYTTKELIHLYDQEALESSLQSLDRNVYGGLVTKDSNEALQVIKRFTNRRFQLRRREIIVG